jgi:hypothetical protein
MVKRNKCIHPSSAEEGGPFVFRTKFFKGNYLFPGKSLNKGSISIANTPEMPSTKYSSLFKGIVLQDFFSLVFR